VPIVSIIVPCYNEQKTIHLLLEALYAQTFPREKMEVVIADGMSEDETRRIVFEWKEQHPALPIHIVDNPQKNIPSGLNCALDAAKGEFIVRLDAHSVPDVDYVERSLHILNEGRGDNVGGIWQIKPSADGWVARSIAIAASHPLAVGGVRYRVGGQPKAVDTVPFGAFRRELIDKIGPYDETLLSNEDYEFNTRIRKAGKIVWFDPGIKSTYFARNTYIELSRQYFRYGFWKFRMLKRYPGTIRWRQGLPPIFVLSLIVFGILAFTLSWARWFLLIELICYLLVILAVGLQVTKNYRDWYLLVGVPLAIISMHVSWGVGFLWSLLKLYLFRQ